MKYNLAIILFFSITIVINAQSISFLDGCISFDQPEGASLWKEESLYQAGRHTLRATYTDEQTLRQMRPHMISRPVRDLIESIDDIDAAILLDLYAEDQSFIWIRAFPMTKEPRSYKVIERSGRVVGEQVFTSSADGLLSPFGYGFEAQIPFQDGLLDLRYIYRDPEQELIDQLPSYFERRDDRWYWRSRESRGDLYQAMVDGDPALVEELRDLYEGWNLMIDSLVIHCDQ